MTEIKPDPQTGKPSAWDAPGPQESWTKPADSSFFKLDAEDLAKLRRMLDEYFRLSGSGFVTPNRVPAYLFAADDFVGQAGEALLEDIARLHHMRVQASEIIDINERRIRDLVGERDEARKLLADLVRNFDAVIYGDPREWEGVGDVVGQARALLETYGEK